MSCKHNSYLINRSTDTDETKHLILCMKEDNPKYFKWIIQGRSFVEQDKLSFVIWLTNQVIVQYQQKVDKTVYKCGRVVKKQEPFNSK